MRAFILCIFEGSPDELNALNTALTLAKADDAEICILHVSSAPEHFSGIIANIGIAAAIEKENDARLKQARAHVSSLVQRHHLPPSIRVLHVTGSTDDLVAKHGQMSDVIVIGRESAPSYDLITPALFNTGTPVLLVPQVPEERLGEWRNKIVSLAWNGSLQSANALRRALPLLQNTEKLHVLVARGHGENVNLEANEELMRYLHSHRLPADVVTVDCGSRATGEALLDKARELRSDLLVMGAYGHSMFREMVLGGVTEYMLQKSDIPLLLAH